MLLNRLNASFTAFLRHPRTAKAAFWVATIAIVLRLLPQILQFIGLDGTAVMGVASLTYESDTLRLGLSLVTMLALAVLWLVLSRMFPKEARLMRYITFALAAMLALSAVWTVLASIFYPPVMPLAQHDTATDIASEVTKMLNTFNTLLNLAAALLLMVRYRGRLQQLGVFIVAQYVVTCVALLAIYILRSASAGMATAMVVSVIHFVLQSALSILLPYFLWRAVGGKSVPTSPQE